MTNEEAIKKIMDFLIGAYQMLIDGNIGNDEKDSYRNLIKVCETAKQALEKQIAKKPIFRYEKIGRENVCVSRCCPNPKCNNTSLGNNEYMFDYCEECGQKLDWGDER